MTDPTIDKHIPIPPRARNRKSTSKYIELVSGMESGDSLAVSTPREAMAVVTAIRRKLRKKPIQRKMKDGSFRIWVTDEPFRSNDPLDMGGKND